MNVKSKEWQPQSSILVSVASWVEPEMNIPLDEDPSKKHVWLTFIFSSFKSVCEDDEEASIGVNLLQQFWYNLELAAK